MSERKPEPNELKVWYIPQIPMKPFEVTVPGGDIKTAALLLNTIIDFSIFEFENKVKPDYSDAAGIARYEEYGGIYGGAFDWFELDEEEWENL